MKRTLEPELMETTAQARAYAEADFEAPHSRLVTLFQERFPEAPRHAHVLDLGCGPGDVALRFATAYPGWMIDGVEGSAAMLAAAEVCHRRHPGLRGRVRLLHGLLPDCRLPRDHYDVVLSNSLLHHLHDPSALWNSVLRYAAPGAPVFIADLRRPATETEARRLTDVYTRGEPDILRHDFHASLLAAFEPDEIVSQLDAAGLAHMRVEIVSDRHVLVWGRR